MTAGEAGAKCGTQ